MRRASEAIVRKRLPMPAVDEVLEELNGCTVFSKLDVRWGFHKIEFFFHSFIGCSSREYNINL